MARGQLLESAPVGNAAPIFLRGSATNFKYSYLHTCISLVAMSQDILSGTSLQGGSSIGLLSVIHHASTQLLWRAFAAAMAQEGLPEFAPTVRQEVHLWAIQLGIFDSPLQPRVDN